MAHIHFSRGRAYELAPNCDENPTEYVESEGERLIKQMVQKQMNKHISLEQQLQKPKEFETCAEFVPITKYTAGQISFAEFKEFAKKITHVEDLKSSGLTEKEIDLLNDYEKGETFFEEKYKKVEVTALQASLQEIYKKLDHKTQEFVDKQPSCNAERGISRHEMELSLSVKPDSDHTKLLQFAMSCQPNMNADSRPLNHPIRSLKEIEHELFDHLKPSVPKRKKRKLNSGIEKKSPAVQMHQVSCSRSEDSCRPSTLWDSHVAPKLNEKVKVSREKSNVSNYSCNPKRLYTVRDGNIIPVEKSVKDMRDIEEFSTASTGQPFVVANLSGKSLVELVPLSMIQENRIKIEDISKYPYFKNYKRGSPSQVLYVKNISSAVEEADLVSFFGHFETSGERRITYRLMTGRMKGQAFITFPSIEKATQAMEALNGCECKGKPLVIEFGRSQS